MMRVLFLQQGLGYGGATKSLMLMQQALHGAVEMFTIIKRNKRLNKVLSGELNYSRKVVECDVPGIHSYSEGTITGADFEKNKAYVPAEIIDFINTEKIDILHINSSVYSHILKPIKENTKCRIVVHIREMLPNGPSHPVDAYILNNTLQYADKIIAISPNELRFFPPSGKLMVLANPHDFSATEKLTGKTAAGNGKLTVGMCANFNPIKGHLVFIRAIKQLNDWGKGADLDFRIIGYPAKTWSPMGLVKQLLQRGYKRKVDRLIRQFHITNLRLVPFTLHVLPQVAKLDIYVRPDLSGNPWGRDIIEAMALSKAVIATGTSDFYIRENETGFLVPAGNAGELAQKIRLLSEDAELRRRLGQNGYAAIKEKCDLPAYRSRLLEIYTNLD